MTSQHLHVIKLDWYEEKKNVNNLGIIFIYKRHSSENSWIKQREKFRISKSSEPTHFLYFFFLAKPIYVYIYIFS